MGTELEQAYDHCQAIAKEHARNFYYAFRTLPTQKRRAIYAAYAFCRLCDDISDEEQPRDEKDRQFAETRQSLLNSRAGTATGPIFSALGDASDVFHIPFEYYEEVIEGVEMDLTKTRFADFEELREYCYKVASVVGLICLEVFGYDDDLAKQYAVELGLAMQITNILRDVKEDAERDRIYLPQDDMARFGYTEQDLMNGVVNDSFRALMAFEVDRARSLFDSSEKLFPLIHSDARSCPTLLHATYRGLLDRIEASGYDVFERRISLSKIKKLSLAAKLWAATYLPSLPPPLNRK